MDNDRQTTSTETASLYVPALEGIGYELRIREPDWYEHRLPQRPPNRVHLHVFARGCPEVDRMLRFRDRLRVQPEAREAYARVKRQLARRNWPTVHYADAKTQVITMILEDADGQGEPAATL